VTAYAEIIIDLNNPRHIDDLAVELCRAAGESPFVEVSVIAEREIRTPIGPRHGQGSEYRRALEPLWMAWRPMAFALAHSPKYAKVETND
jgi:hypothetical protein